MAMDGPPDDDMPQLEPPLEGPPPLEDPNSEDYNCVDCHTTDPICLECHEMGKIPLDPIDEKKAPLCDDKRVSDAKTTFRALNYDETGMVPPQQPVEEGINADEVGDLVAVLIKNPTVISSDTNEKVYLYEFTFKKQENEDHSSLKQFYI